jgi:hypothetical protein
VPEELMAGWAEKRELLLFMVAKFTVWPDSLAGPDEIAVAQFGTDCAPEFCATVWSAPLVNEGASFTGLTVMLTVAVFDVVSPSETW